MTLSAGYLQSIASHRAAQRRQNLVGVAVLGLATLAGAGLLAPGLSPVMPVLILVLCAAVVAVGTIWRHPEVALYLLFVAALDFEQFEIAGLHPITAQTHFFQTLNGFTPLSVPVSPAEMVLLLTLAAVFLPKLAKTGRPVVKGALFGPVIFFLVAIVAAFAYGAVAGPAGTRFDVNAAWAEARSFMYLIATYFLACNLITDRKRLNVFVWLFVGGLCFKGLQGIKNYISEKQGGVALEAITGHEDVIFFSVFFLLLAAMLVFGAHHRQKVVMLWGSFPIFFTLLATKRRIGFIVLAVGVLMLALGMLAKRRALLFKIGPWIVIPLVVYSAVFWNAADTGTASILAQPIRAFKSQLGQGSERDELSNKWRELEKQNIAFNIKGAPLTGLGFGRPYELVVPEPSLDATGFTYWHYMTHNAVFWVWMKMGLLGFVAFWFLLGSGIIRGLLIFRNLSDGYLQALALVAAALPAMQVFYSYGDLGLTYSRPMIVLGCVLGMLVTLPGLDEPAPAPAATARPRGRGYRRVVGASEG